MIDITLTFTIADAVQVFRNAGLTVEMRQEPYSFPRHGSGEETHLLDVWVVVNPNTGYLVLLETIFKQYIELKKRELFLQEDNKLKIINLFSK